MLLSPERVDREISHVYSDAAFSSKTGEATIGAVWLRDGIRSQAFSIKPVIPPWARGLVHIGVLELIAVDVARRLFSGLNAFWSIFHVDNSGGVFNLTSGKSNCALSQAVVEETVFGMQCSDIAGYYAYIRTDRNLVDCATRMEKLHLLVDAFDPEFLAVGPDSVPWSRYKALFDMMTSMDSGSEVWDELLARTPRVGTIWDSSVSEMPSPEAKRRRG